MVKNSPANAGDVRKRAQSLGRGDPLEKEMTAHSSILAWRIPWTEKPGRLQSMRLQRVKHNWSANTFKLLLSQVGKLRLEEVTHNP